jgi:Kef-type K+ transport system membrane component KefB
MKVANAPGLVAITLAAVTWLTALGVVAGLLVLLAWTQRRQAVKSTSPRAAASIAVAGVAILIACSLLPPTRMLSFALVATVAALLLTRYIYVDGYLDLVEPGRVSWVMLARNLVQRPDPAERERHGRRDPYRPCPRWLPQRRKGRLAGVFDPGHAQVSLRKRSHVPVFVRGRPDL